MTDTSAWLRLSHPRRKMMSMSNFPSEPLSIDCDECILQHTDACGDCIVTFLCGVETERPVVVNLAEARAMRALGDAGLAPPLRHRATMGG